MEILSLQLSEWGLLPVTHWSNQESSNFLWYNMNNIPRFYRGPTTNLKYFESFRLKRLFVFPLLLACPLSITAIDSTLFCSSLWQNLLVWQSVSSPSPGFFAAATKLVLFAYKQRRRTTCPFTNFFFFENQYNLKLGFIVSISFVRVFIPVVHFFYPFFLPSAPVLQISVSKVLLGSLPNFHFDSAHCLRFHRLPADVSTCCRLLLLFWLVFSPVKRLQYKRSKKVAPTPSHRPPL